MASHAGAGKGRDRPNARARAAALREQQRKKDARRKMLTIGGIVAVVVAVVAVIVIIALNKPDKKNTSAAGRTPVDPAIVKQVTTVPAATFDKGDTSAVSAPPTKVTGPPLTFNGKPGVLYLGAEYCPYCATERWPFVMALSRFGTWSNLSVTKSSSTDVFPSTPTFSFHGATFTSPYLALQTVETQDSNSQPLETPTAEQTALLNKYDTKGSIPFIDYGNKFVSIGASYNPGVLSGKSMDEIAAAAVDPTTKVGKSVLGTANVITAAVCETTGGKPGSVCDTPTITKLRTALNSEK